MENEDIEITKLLIYHARQMADMQRMFAKMMIADIKAIDVSPHSQLGKHFKELISKYKEYIRPS